jgi:exodeoxyribonuclease-3
MDDGLIMLPLSLSMKESGMLKLASWNVNSLKVRLDHVLSWIESAKIDILALQETKLLDEHFPGPIFTEKGYHVLFAGQKTYNGVALISRFPMSEGVTDITDLVDPQRRILAATIGDIRVINLYVPN